MAEESKSDPTGDDGAEFVFDLDDPEASDASIRAVLGMPPMTEAERRRITEESELAKKLAAWYPIGTPPPPEWQQEIMERVVQYCPTPDASSPVTALLLPGLFGESEFAVREVPQPGGGFPVGVFTCQLVVRGANSLPPLEMETLRLRALEFRLPPPGQERYMGYRGVKTESDAVTASLVESQWYGDGTADEDEEGHFVNWNAYFDVEGEECLNDTRLYTPVLRRDGEGEWTASDAYFRTGDALFAEVTLPAWPNRETVVVLEVYQKSPPAAAATHGAGGTAGDTNALVSKTRTLAVVCHAHTNSTRGASMGPKNRRKAEFGDVSPPTLHLKMMAPEGVFVADGDEWGETVKHDALRAVEDRRSRAWTDRRVRDGLDRGARDRVDGGDAATTGSPVMSQEGLGFAARIHAIVEEMDPSDRAAFLESVQMTPGGWFEELCPTQDVVGAGSGAAGDSGSDTPNDDDCAAVSEGPTAGAGSGSGGGGD